MLTHDQDTICGVATSLGASGIAIVRLSGDRAAEIARILAGLRAVPRQRELRLCRLRNADGELLDVAMVCVMRRPCSYTGEDVAELQLHGGTAVATAVMGACLGAGARLARPGEFTLRRFLNGKIDLSKAEAIGALVSAQGERARRMALRQLEGGLGDVIGSMRHKCLAWLAGVEAQLDFPEEDLEPLDQPGMIQGLRGLERELERLIAQFPRAQRLRRSLRIVLLGRPNVGKSSLLNALVGRERAIVHAEPGTTRDYLEDELVVGGLSLSLVDTAGLRQAATEQERMGVEKGWKQAEQADFVALVVNLGEGCTTEDRQLLDRLHPLPHGLILTQSDQTESGLVAELQREFLSQVVGVTSARTGEGLRSLRRELARRASGEDSAQEELPLVTEERHVEVLSQARERLGAAVLALQSGEPEEIVALELREATRQLGALLGLGVTEDVLNEIFNRFCIGK